MCYSSIAHRWFRLPSAPVVPSSSQVWYTGGVRIVHPWQMLCRPPGTFASSVRFPVSFVGWMVLNALSLSCPTKRDAKQGLVPLSVGLMFELGDSGLIFQSFYNKNHQIDDYFVRFALIRLFRSLGDSSGMIIRARLDTLA